MSIRTLRSFFHIPLPSGEWAGFCVRRLQGSTCITMYRACPAAQECAGQSPHQRTGAVPGLLAKTKVGKAFEHRRGLGRLSPNNIDGMAPAGAFLSPLTGRR